MDIDYDDDLVDQSYTPKENNSETDEVAGQSDNSDEDSENDLKIPNEGKMNGTLLFYPKILKYWNT